MDTLRNDIRYALRTLLRSPGFTVAAVLTLALGIGANSGVFSVLNGVVLRPLPYPDPERVVYLGWDFGKGWNTFQTAYKFAYIRAHARTLEGISTHKVWATEIGENQVPDEVQGLQVTEDFFRVNGIQPELGRGFAPEEDRPGGARVIVLGDQTWRTRFAADPAILGKTVRLGGEEYTVVGVMPRGFRFPEAPGAIDFFVPFQLDPDPRDMRMNYLVRARLRPGVTAEQAMAELRAISSQFRQEHPELMDENEVGVRLLGYQDIFVQDLEGSGRARSGSGWRSVHTLTACSASSCGRV